MEHLSTFGLSRDPFANEAQLSFYFASPGHKEAERRLARGIAQAKGLCVLTGAGGVGKTMLVRHLLDSLEEELVEACMLVPVPGVTDASWVLTRFARQLGVEEPADEPAEVLGQVYERLAVVREDGRHAVLLMDEAQVLADQGVLRELRGLLNLEYEDRRLLTVVLVGLPGLEQAIADEPALRDRVELRVSLPAFDAETSAAYLAHRIRCAEGHPSVLESSARAALVKRAGGSPRRLNNLADGALFEAHLAGRVSATAEDVERAAQELGLAESSDEDVTAPGPSGAALRRVAAAPQPAAAPPPPRASRGARAGAPPRSRADADVTTIFGDTGDATDELADAIDEVFAADTSPPVASGGQAERTVLFSDEPPRRRGAAAPTVAMFADADGVAGEGDVEDLFADLVDD